MFYAPLRLCSQGGRSLCRSLNTRSASLFLKASYSLISSFVAALTAGTCLAATFFPQSGHLHGISYFDFMPQEYVYVPLDIFRGILHNKGIKSELDAWLTFLCEDDPEMIEFLIRQYPQFRELYNEVYKLCENMEDIMGCFSEALQEMDRNTVQYMIEEQQAQIEQQQSQIKEKDSQLEEMRVAVEKEAKEKIAAIERMLKLGKLSVEEIAECQSVSVQTVREIEGGMQQKA
ncbi:MAG: hypothetical protein LUI13_08190 [Lachnospiraceae bacterium]|nr:hypothetical protein [Lachnospiraceae bacterium]